jgi:hypothetical protein
MPSPQGRRWTPRVLAVLVMAGAVLGVLPPAIGGVPPTVVRSVGIGLDRLVPDGGRSLRAPGAVALMSRKTWSEAVVTCAPIRFTMVGVTWRQGGESVIPARVAWGTRDGLGRPVKLFADPDEAPDADSAEAATALSGTPPLWTGEARCARVRLRLPAGEGMSDVRAVFINTSGTATDPSTFDAVSSAMARVWGMASPEPSAAITADPAIIPRAGWGAKEGMRRCGNPDYADDGVQMAYVHHTVNSNGYGKSKADDLIRGIYAYHVKGRGYCDIAYNFLIDRFGRIFEGRYGGIDQPVIGAHAMGFNTGSVGVAALGTFTVTNPPKAMVKAFTRLLAWRLDVAHVRPTGTAVMTSGGGPATKFDKGKEVTLAAISGHRDTGLTTCPGGRLYRRLRVIRRGAEVMGLPKIWNPTQSAEAVTIGTPVTFGASLSGSLNWSVEVRDFLGVVVSSGSGGGGTVSHSWTPTVPGTYSVSIKATNSTTGAVAREATLSLTVS